MDATYNILVKEFLTLFLTPVPFHAFTVRGNCKILNALTQKIYHKVSRFTVHVMNNVRFRKKHYILTDNGNDKTV